ncbi:MAG: RecQ family ATP-dependent DNA helicase [Bacteroidales bacterium]|nr:RecQ family ATP-dependent DNA helicase [Bacteroidales bacterium]
MRTNEEDFRQRARAVLKQHWGYDSFRPLQEDIILSVLEGRDTLALLPTGGGKSICFQVPALVKGGLCIVISPLIALMKDQVEHLRARHIKAGAIYSGMRVSEIQATIDNCLFDPEYRFLYVSPERLQTDNFKVNFERMPVSMIAVDEAHCISQWGYDFRPPYLEIAKIRKIFPEVPVLALTATATPEVVKDIQLRLDFKTENIFQKSFKRANLTYFVVNEEDKNSRMLRIMNRYPGSGIVYVRNRRKTAETAELLRNNGISADHYHAGLDPRERDRKQQSWMKGETRVMVSTNAFGMGIDKPDVRFVVHLDLPDTLEAYFQEAGRAGRDEQPAVAILLYDNYDIAQLKRNFTFTFPELDRVREVYRELCQSHHIELGSGQGKTFPFSMEAHANAVKMNATQYFNALKLLNNIGVILISEHLREKSELQFRINGDQLLKFQKEKPEFEPLITTILRSYSGVFTQFADIDEQLLATRLETTEETVVEQLKTLRGEKILSYQPQSNIPLIIFLKDRIDEKYLYFDKKIYDFRKEKAEERLAAVENYVKCDNVCRSQLLLQYFGEWDSTPCGECDVCRRNKIQRVKNSDFELISKEIKELQQQNMDPKQILAELSKRYEEPQIVKVMRWLADNNTL